MVTRNNIGNPFVIRNKNSIIADIIRMPHQWLYIYRQRCGFNRRMSTIIVVCVRDNWYTWQYVSCLSRLSLAFFLSRLRDNDISLFLSLNIVRCVSFCFPIKILILSSTTSLSRYYKSRLQSNQIELLFILCTKSLHT